MVLHYLFSPLVAEVSIDPSSFTVWEHNESVWFDISISGGVQKAPGQQCEILVYTVNGTATGKCAVEVYRCSSLH